MADDKFTKAEVHYGHGHPDAHCGICRHYRKPGTCAIVEGEIDWRYWCEKFAKAARAP